MNETDENKEDILAKWALWKKLTGDDKCWSGGPPEKIYGAKISLKVILHWKRFCILMLQIWWTLPLRKSWAWNMIFKKNFSFNIMMHHMLANKELSDHYFKRLALILWGSTSNGSRVKHKSHFQVQTLFSWSFSHWLYRKKGIL